MPRTSLTPMQLLPSSRQARLDGLTGLRALAAGLVFALHLRNTGVFSGQPQAVLSVLFGGGASAVSLFFILSGFVLAWSHRPGTSFATIWWNRLLRIAPLHLIAFSLALVVGATVSPSIRTADPAANLANLFLVSAWRADWWQAGNPVSWSLVCEAFFYLLSPFLIRVMVRLTRRGVVAVCIGAIGATWAAPALIAALAPQLSPYSNPLARLPEFVLGIALATLMRTHHWRGPRLILAAPLAVGGYVAATAVAATPYGAAACTVIGFGALIAAFARADREGAGTWLSHRIWMFLGDRSFAFYLVHLLALQTAIGLLPELPTRSAAGPFALALLALSSALALACVLHTAVEQPLMRAFRR